VKERADFILSHLKELYPSTTTALVHRNPFQLLIATILSAQTTDVQVNKVTPSLFRRFPSPKNLASASIEEIEERIKTLGFFHSKAKYLKTASQQIMDEFGGVVPDSMEKLITLSGVARKTANIVLAHGYGKQEGIAVDTHVKRLSGRLGLSLGKTPEKIEIDLISLIPREDWGLFSDLLIEHGRAVCNSRRPRCDKCTLHSICPYPHRTATDKS